MVVNSWVHFAYAAHMRHMTYAAYDICGAHMRDICGICRLGLNKFKSEPNGFPVEAQDCVGKSMPISYGKTHMR